MDPTVYLNMISELGYLARELPTFAKESWSAYTTRIGTAFQIRRRLQPIPPELRQPLPASALKASQAGQDISIVLREAKPPVVVAAHRKKASVQDPVTPKEKPRGPVNLFKVT
jgi:hypothetical protein